MLKAHLWFHYATMSVQLIVAGKPFRLSGCAQEANTLSTDIIRLKTFLFHNASQIH